MRISYHQFIKDINKINLEDVCSDWQWLLNNEYNVIMVSNTGDLFLSAKNKSVHWLDTGTGQLQKIANDTEQFYTALNDLENIDKWLLASVVLDLIEKDLILQENEVYSYKIMPILGGDYPSENFEITDISVHFSITGQIYRQVKDLPEGTKINNVVINPFKRRKKG